jgi:Lrp/AsnC family transcriptional regulator for asnA, asnC and gidA
MSKFDEYDRRILEILQDDGTLSNIEIANVLGISEATVRRRRAQLQENDVMRVVAVANPFKLGFKVMTIIGIQVEQSKLREVERALVARPEVRFLGLTLGEYDLLLEAWFRSNEELLHFVTVVLAQMQGISRTESFQVMHLAKYTYDWGTPTAARQILADESPLSV